MKDGADDALTGSFSPASHVTTLEFAVASI